jgi:hypothetical protein
MCWLRDLKEVTEGEDADWVARNKRRKNLERKWNIKYTRTETLASKDSQRSNKLVS